MVTYSRSLNDSHEMLILKDIPQQQKILKGTHLHVCPLTSIFLTLSSKSHKKLS